MEITKDKIEEICITLSERTNLNKPEMVNKQKFIENAVNWIKNRDNLEKYLHIQTSLIDNYAEAFRKAMEE